MSSALPSLIVTVFALFPTVFIHHPCPPSQSAQRASLLLLLQHMQMQCNNLWQDITHTNAIKYIKRWHSINPIRDLTLAPLSLGCRDDNSTGHQINLVYEGQTEGREGKGG